MTIPITKHKVFADLLQLQAWVVAAAAVVEVVEACCRRISEERCYDVNAPQCSSGRSRRSPRRLRTIRKVLIAA